MNTEIYLNNNAKIIDVRTLEEYKGGHVVGSINIPLQEIQLRIEEIKSMNQPLILCCATGNRSGVASHYLKNQGVDCINGGSWLDVNYYQSQIV
ncbi:rhodanese-like domain-containing protein [uncultured Planktosalinus sp.]|uniref:rhodanese-like domain-containing protein n=1 Tax=uncultured Planktosalinus sp. TaxID=1810935 RepID=UPI0030D9C90F|tara:strand:- start:326 stop:607 length:282 start_codon:yes stop_codon:yes gene_type:complete